jgi:hypothetical protein
MKSWLGKNKEFVRSNHTGTKGKRYVSMLDLPGNLCLSTKHFYNAGQIGSWTDVVAIEGLSEEIEAVTNGLQDMSFKSVNVVCAILQEWIPDRMFDLVNLDLCCPIRPNTLKWLNGLELLDGGDLSINTMIVARCKKINSFKLGLKRTFSSGVGLSVVNRLIDQHPVLSHEPEEAIYVIAAVATSMTGYEFGTIHPTVEYKDGDPGNQMRVYNFCNAKKCNPTLPMFSEIYSGAIDYSSDRRKSPGDTYTGSSLRYKPETECQSVDEQIRQLIEKIGADEALKALRSLVKTPAC